VKVVTKNGEVFDVSHDGTDIRYAVILDDTEKLKEKWAVCVYTLYKDSEDTGSVLFEKIYLEKPTDEQIMWCIKFVTDRMDDELEKRRVVAEVNKVYGLIDAY
jgi:hypothetical protein